MAGGAPVPIPVPEREDKILSIKDLEKAASKKLGKTAGGKNFSIGKALNLDVLFVGMRYYMRDSLLLSV